MLGEEFIAGLDGISMLLDDVAGTGESVGELTAGAGLLVPAFPGVPGVWVVTSFGGSLLVGASPRAGSVLGEVDLAGAGALAAVGAMGN